MTGGEAKRLIGTLAIHYPREKFSAERLDLFAALISDLELGEAAAAAVAWMATEKYFPEVSAFRTAVLSRRGALPPDVDLAWGEVQLKLRTIGSRGIPLFTHPAITEAVAAMGWQSLCNSTTPMADRAHFAKFYASTSKRAALDAQVAGVSSLVGPVSELLIGKRAAGFAPLPPRGERMIPLPGETTEEGEDDVG